MPTHAISSAAPGHANEDLVAVFEQGERADILILDGATSVSGQNYIDAEAGDPAWFVGAFVRAFGAIVNPSDNQQTLVARAIAATRAAAERKSAAAPVPAYARPIAALTWLRVTSSAAGVMLHLYALGDCKVLLRLPNGEVRDLDPYHNPQEGVVQDAVAQLLAQGVADPAERKARLLPMLRARREQQQADAAPAILCLDPQGPFNARTRSVALAPGATLLALTDGFYRLVDPYCLYTDSQLVAACQVRGLAAMVDELRTYEASHLGAGALAVKRSDDASAVIWHSALPALA